MTYATRTKYAVEQLIEIVEAQNSRRFKLCDIIDDEFPLLNAQEKNELLDQYEEYLLGDRH